jgi:membrane-bound ClpP family serine protease
MDSVQDWFGNSVLNCIYGGALGLGLLYALLLLIIDGLDNLFTDIGDIFHLGDLFHGGADVGGHHGGDGSGLSMIAIAAFISAFGAFGLGANAFETGAGVSLLVAGAGGFVFGGLAQLFFIYILSPTTSSIVSQASLEGKVAEVTTPIPEKGIGQIALVAEGGRVTYSARSHDGKPLSRGAEVRIEKIIGSVASVAPTEEFEP